PPFEAGPLKGVTLDPREAILDYFDTLGLDARGVPTREIMVQLGLNGFLKELDNAKGMDVPSFVR
ncbi:MAG: hypothetical protein ACTSU9_01990, partial [Promethearchaeota archaeon]